MVKDGTECCGGVRVRDVMYLSVFNRKWLGSESASIYYSSLISLRRDAYDVGVYALSPNKPKTHIMGGPWRPGSTARQRL